MDISSRILIVEDDAVLVLDLQDTLTQMGYQVLGIAATGKDAVELALAQNPDVILMDINLGDEVNGIQAAEEIHKHQDTPIIYLTAYMDETQLQQAKITNAYAYLSKPVREKELRASLEVTLYKYAAEKALRASEGLFRAVVANSHDGIILMGADRRPIYVSPSYTKINGYAPEEWIGAYGPDFVHPEDQEYVARVFNQILQNPEKAYLLEYRLRHKQGYWFWVETTATSMLNDPDVKAIVLNSRDITERKQAEDALQTRLQLHEYADTRTLDELIQFLLDRAEQLTYSSIGFFHFLEPDQQTLRLQTWSTNTLKKMCTAQGKGTHYPVEQAGVWADCIRQQKPIIHNDYANLEARKGLPDGHAPIKSELVFPILRGGRLMAVIGVGNKAGDYTQADIQVLSDLMDMGLEIIWRKQIEEALKSSQNLADIGTMTASIIHEIRSLLQVITGISDGLVKETEHGKVEPERMKHRAEMLSRNAWRITDIANSLLRYARFTSGEMQDNDINEIVHDTLLLMQHQLSLWSNITIRTELETNPPLLLCDRNKMTQVLINLLTNARDAMPNGGEITISTQLDRSKKTLSLLVADQGTGIPEDIRGKIFTPFFTTKSSGQGTGLGLAIVKDIMHAQGGEIALESTVGEGSVFRLSFPNENLVFEEQNIRRKGIEC